MSSNRRKPFSAKAKKKQLQEKRHRKAQTQQDGSEFEFKDRSERNKVPGKGGPTNAASSTAQPVAVGDDLTQGAPQKDMSKAYTVTGRGRRAPHVIGKDLKTVFATVPKEEIDKRLKASHKPLRRLDHFPTDLYYGERLDIPIRPKWSVGETKEVVEAREESYFEEYLTNIYTKYSTSRLNFFEHNLEVWRELWRVCEFSDVLLVLADCRHPVFHFPPSLYHYITSELKKPFILVLTKTDLLPDEIVHKWMAYFEKKFPKLLCTTVNSMRKKEGDEPILGGKKRRKRDVTRKGRRYYRGGTKGLIALLNRILQEKGYKPLDLPEDDEEDKKDKDAENKEEEQDDDILGVESDEKEEEDEDEDEDDKDDDLENEEEPPPPSEADELVVASASEQKKFLTLGLVGHPNVGKSSLINTLMGRKVCSTSRSPGHTKYRQTIFLSESVMLCDCPGLVFPAVDIPRQLQIVAGIFPISQVREPYTAVGYIAERIPLEKLYHLKKIYTEHTEWSAFEICEAYAEKRGYHTKKGRPDPYRAGLEILKDIFDGRMTLYFSPESASINIYAYDPTSAPNEDDGVNAQAGDEREIKVQKTDFGASHVEEKSDDDGDEEDEESSEGLNAQGKGKASSFNPFAALDGATDESDDDE